MAQSLSNRSRLLEKYSQVVREDGLNTNQNVNIGINGATPDLWVAGNITAGGTITSTGSSGATTITSSSANALAVGPAGTTNPSFQVDASTASAVTGIKIKAAASASGTELSVISSGSNEPLVLNGKGSGNVVIGNNSTGTVYLGRGGKKALISSCTVTALTGQNTTPTAAQLLGGVIEHASATGAGTATLDTATNIIAGIAFAATGDTFECLYANTGSQTVTITTNTGLTLKGAVAITTGLIGKLRFVLMGGGLINVYCTVS
jgi:hypothetical protein